MHGRLYLRSRTLALQHLRPIARQSSTLNLVLVDLLGDLQCLLDLADFAAHSGRGVVPTTTLFVSIDIRGVVG